MYYISFNVAISAWHKVGGFFEDLFIDGVDIDFCYLIRKHGFRILRINSIQLLHELGHSQAITILGKKLFSVSPSSYSLLLHDKKYIVSRYQTQVFLSFRTNNNQTFLFNGRLRIGQTKKAISYFLWN